MSMINKRDQRIRRQGRQPEFGKCRKYTEPSKPVKRSVRPIAPMAPASSSSPATTSVQVALRIRPQTTQDSTSIPARFQRSVIHATSSNTVSIEAVSVSTPGSAASNVPSTPSSGSTAKKQLFAFDQVHPPPTTQYDLYSNTAKPLVSRFIEGFNCTILAYGQTSSGKTFTMTGTDLDADPTDSNNGMGIIPRAVSAIFSGTKKLKEERGSMWNYSIKASFVELYNEDLIDLLSLDDSVGGRREVQIREDKDGHIIWGGLREVNVKNVAEVMSLLRKGTSIRRTNETDMNAQSSRSHAIFSLTLTQKKFTGSTPPPRSSSPLPPNGRSPSRLARPGSMMSSPTTPRVGSPTLGRPSTPSFAAAMGRGGLRPGSALGHANERPTNGNVDDDRGDWVTITSKFHFVDLAGSERLKRTAAAGERIKEGISINSGLLALGNVISALGDPSRSKSHTASHVPYRDSKLTRLLQDSLGGNAHTLMVACVSPAEWNAAETINTLKYANRARNIKNRAVLNEKEDGWDDIEWLQGTITRLRKELKTIKEGGIVIVNDTPQEPEGASKKVLAQMTELQNNYEDLRSKFVERTEELTRLRREFGEKHRTSNGVAGSATGRYEEIVGPVIEEYEKTIGAMEAELGLNRAALRHTNELVEEKEEELTAITERHAATELYVQELRSRVAKLTERETSTEAYIRDLEEKIRSYDETSITSSESMTDLKREISRYKDAESSSATYIAELEARLGRSDESVITLQQTIENLENECERRRDEVKKLQSRLDTLHQDGQNWRTDLEEREQKVKELESKMTEWENKRKEANDARARLGNVVNEVASARRSLEVDLENLPSTSEPTPSQSPTAETAPDTVQASHDSNMKNQLVALQHTHTATLADLSSVTAKYRDALREISDLAAQIQEAKLSNAEPTRSDSPDKLTETPVFRRRMTGGNRRDPSDPQYNSERRHFFRQAASAESLRARSLSQSQSLSQELSSVHSRKTSFSSHGTSSSHSPSNSHSQQTLTYLSGVRPNLSISLPSLSPGNGYERSVGSLEKEIMRLQEVLKEREAEIGLLEGSLKQYQNRDEMSESPAFIIEDAPKVNGKSHSPAAVLSPKTINRFNNARKAMENGGGQAHSDAGSEASGSTAPSESLDRWNELMLSMAQKESNHREVVDNLNSQLSQVQRQLDDLTTLSRDQALNMSAEIEGLNRKHNEDLSRLDEYREQATSLREALKDAQSAHASDIEEVRTRHQATLDAKGLEIDELVSRLKKDHETSLADLREELSTAAATLEKTHRDHEAIFGKLKAERDVELRRRLQEVDDVLVSTREEHERLLSKVKAQHEETLKQRDAEANAVLQRTEEEYYNALTKLRGDHAGALQKQAADLSSAMERLKEEHAAEWRVAEIARQGALSESQSSQAAALQELQDAHAATVARKESSFAEEVETLKAEHERTLVTRNDDFALQMDRLRLEYESVLAKLKEERRAEVDQLNHTLAEAQDENIALTNKAQRSTEEAVRVAKEQQALVFQELERGHQDELEALKRTHRVELQTALKEVEEKRAALAQSYTEQIAKLKSQHQQEITDINATMIALQEGHLANVASIREQNQRTLSEEQDHHSEILSALDEKHKKTLDTLRSQNELLGVEKDQLSKTIDNLQRDHRVATEKIESQMHMLGDEKEHLSNMMAASETQHRESIEAAQTRAESLDEEKHQLVVSIAGLKKQHSEELEALRSEHELVLQELASHKVAADEFTLVREQARQLHEKELAQKSDDLKKMESRLTSASNERDDLETEVAQLNAALDKTREEQSKLIREASKRESLVEELDRHRSIMAEIQEDLQKVKDEKDAISVEKSRAESLVRDLQAQIARSASPPNVRSVSDRNMSYNRATGLPAIKLPPPTPPPSVPPPPAPTPRSAPISSDMALGTPIQLSATSSSIPHSPAHSALQSPSHSDPKLMAKFELQTKQIEEQEAMIKTLNKQLSHCETDLQTHMDLVNNLENSLGDSEKNLRKARMHATEIARERDTLNTKIMALQNELTEAKREVVSVRRSIVEEKQSLEHKLDEERRAKERARQQLDTRMDELQMRKSKSKFACI